MNISDREFLKWIHDRLQCIHGENPNHDYMVRLRKITMKMESKGTLWNTGTPDTDRDVLVKDEEGDMAVAYCHKTFCSWTPNNVSAEEGGSTELDLCGGVVGWRELPK